MKYIYSFSRKACSIWDEARAGWRPRNDVCCYNIYSLNL